MYFVNTNSQSMTTNWKINLVSHNVDNFCLLTRITAYYTTKLHFNLKKTVSKQKFILRGVVSVDFNFRVADPTDVILFKSKKK